METVIDEAEVHGRFEPGPHRQALSIPYRKIEIEVGDKISGSIPIEGT